MNAQSELLPSSVHYFITAIVDPGVISRVTELFALRGITPDFLKVSRYKQTASIPENLSIDIRVSNLGSAEQEVILQKLSSQICVQNVRKEEHFLIRKLSA
jgi:acetolactate synthase small subunit